MLGISALFGLFVSSVLLANSPPENATGIQITTEVIPLDIWFPEGKAVVKRGPHNTPVLKILEKRLKESSIVHVEIEGNPDAKGTADTNKALSLRRAEALRDTVSDLYGIPADRIQADTAGASAVSVQKAVATASDQPSPIYIILYRLDSGNSPAQGRSL